MLRMRYTTVIMKTSFFNKMTGYFRKFILCNKIQFFTSFYVSYIYRIINIIKRNDEIIKYGMLQLAL